MTDQADSTDFNRRCRRCGTAVTRRFVQVFGIDDSVHGCLNCLPRKRLSNGDAAKRQGAVEDATETRTEWYPVDSR